jgi:hypothetical protein
LALDGPLVPPHGFAFLAVSDLAGFEIEEKFDFPGTEGVAHERAAQDILHKPVKLPERGIRV